MTNLSEQHLWVAADIDCACGNQRVGEMHSDHLLRVLDIEHERHVQIGEAYEQIKRQQDALVEAIDEAEQSIHGEYCVSGEWQDCESRHHEKSRAAIDAIKEDTRGYDHGRSAEDEAREDLEHDQ